LPLLVRCLDGVRFWPISSKLWKEARHFWSGPELDPAGTARQNPKIAMSPVDALGWNRKMMTGFEIAPHFKPNARAVVFEGDCRDMLREVPSASIQLVVTSPPYNLGKEFR
jgi:hypothetical protein